MVTSAPNSKVTDNKETKIGLEINQEMESPNLRLQQQITLISSVFPKKQPPMFERVTQTKSYEPWTTRTTDDKGRRFERRNEEGYACALRKIDLFSHYQRLHVTPKLAQLRPWCPKRAKSLFTVAVCRCVTLDIVV